MKRDFVFADSYSEPRLKYVVLGTRHNFTLMPNSLEDYGYQGKYRSADTEYAGDFIESDDE